jgi:poly-gamma-glutamate synthesis protein (capsule biosynthesis protein)
LLPDYFTYNSDPALVTSFRRPDGRNSFTALATCNNHALDRGDDGLRDTLAFLDAQGMIHAGVRASADEKPYAVVRAGDFTLGFYAACWGLNSPAALARSALHIEVLPGLAPRVRLPVDLTRIQRALEGMAQEKVDFRVVYLHWGYEFEFYPCPDLMQVGREIVRLGADVVMGSHPHVVQPCEVCFVNGAAERYRQRWPDLEALTSSAGCLLEDGTGVPRKGLIAYSLGNFTTAMYTLHCQVGLVLSLTLARDEQTGRVDWHHPEAQLVYNEQRDPLTGKRQLWLLEPYLRERERGGDHATALRRVGRTLEAHLLGSP